MRSSLLPWLALVCALGVGCGDEGGTAQDPSTSDPMSDKTPAPVAADWTEVAVVSATAAGGTVSTSPARLDTEEALDAFAAQFERPGLGDQVRDAVAGAEVPEGHVPAGAVIAIGCDVPPGVSVVTDGPVRVVPDKVAIPLKECFAPVTSVAVVTLAESLL